MGVVNKDGGEDFNLPVKSQTKMGNLEWDTA